MIKLEFRNGAKAKFKNGRWLCTDRELGKNLNLSYLPEPGDAPAEGEPGAAAANRAAKALNALLTITPSGPPPDKEVVY